MPLQTLPLSVPEDYSDKKIARLNLEKLQDLLDDQDIVYDADAEKHELQALWTLFRMGLIDHADELIVDTARFWKLKVVDQLQELRTLGLSRFGNKFEHVINYVDSLVDYDSDSEEKSASDEESDDAVIQSKGKGIGKEKATSNDPNTTKANTIAEPVSSNTESSAWLPHPHVVNFLNAIIFMDVSRANYSDTTNGCPVDSVNALKKHLSALPILKSDKQLREVLESHPSKKVLKWMCDRHGKDFSIATDSTRIPGLPNKVPQFIINTHPPKNVASFQKHFKKASSKSMVLFHGTHIDRIRPIIATGFHKTGDMGVFLAEDPRTSYPYAGRHYDHRQFAQSTPYRDYGALFGCEVTGDGELSTDDKWEGRVHVVRDPSRIIPRYVFLLPMKDIHAMGNFQQSTPRRADMEKAMLDGFKFLRTRDQQSLTEENKEALRKRERES